MFDRIRNIFRRQSLNQPNTPLNDRTFSSYFSARSAAGAVISDNNTLSLSSVWRAVKIVSETIASIPVNAYRIDRATGNRQLAYDHPIDQLVAYAPHDLYNSFTWRETMVMQCLLYGNSYAVIGRGRVRREIKNLTIIDHPSRVEAFLDEQSNLFYRIRDIDQTFRAADVIHLKGLSRNGLAGLDVLSFHADNFGLALGSRQYASNFYRSGASLNGYLRHPGKLSDEGRRNLKASWSRQYDGVGSANAGGTPLLEEGMEFIPAGLNPAEAAYGDTYKITIADVARIFGVPQFLLEDLDRATFNNIEHLSKMFVQYTVMPWTKRIEAELSNKLFGQEEKMQGYCIKFSLNDLLQADLESQAEYLSKLFSTGTYSINDIRKTLGLNPVEDGDKHFVPLNMVELGADNDMNDNEQDNDQGEEGTDAAD